jgi:hypothetical protein
MLIQERSYIENQPVKTNPTIRVVSVLRKVFGGDFLQTVCHTGAEKKPGKNTLSVIRIKLF